MQMCEVESLEDEETAGERNSLTAKAGKWQVGKIFFFSFFVTGSLSDVGKSNKVKQSKCSLYDP